MISHTLADELEQLATALAATEPDLAKLKIQKGQTHKTRETPSLVISCEPDRMFSGQRRGQFVRVSLTIESAVGDDARPDPDNHLSRVRLVSRLFVKEKAARLAELAARGKLIATDWGQVPSRPEIGGGETGEKMRSQIVLLASVKEAPTV